MHADLDAPIDLDHVRIDASVALRVPEALALRRRVLAFGREGDTTWAACENPRDDEALDALERVLGTKIVALQAEPASLERAFARVFQRREEPRGDEAIRLVDELMHAALLEQASDVHLAPTANALRVRFRVDGVLETHRELALSQMSTVMNRVKVLAGMDIAERRLPQDGRFTYTLGRGANERSIDVRAAVMPTRHGERATLRLFGMTNEALTLPRLGMLDRDLAPFRAELGHPHGLVLITGPTGSGKTTTLYAGLRELDLTAQNVLTIEDPIEYDVAGVSQIEVDTDDRIGFESALRSVLRHDPDVLMIGEIRDLTSAEVAVKASLTGHLVLSTLHTNSAVGAVTRLVDMGVAPYLVGATLRLAAAQRLVRRLCPRCRVARALERVEALAFGVEARAGAEVFDARGCVFCKHSGYAGRMGLFECFRPGRELRAEIAAGAGEARLAELAIENGMHTLRADAAEKVLAGWTSPAEALRALEVV